MADIREDFPEPTVPTTATNWPGIMSKFTLKERSAFEGDEGNYSGGVRAPFQIFCGKSGIRRFSLKTGQFVLDIQDFKVFLNNFFFFLALRA